MHFAVKIFCTYFVTIIGSKIKRLDMATAPTAILHSCDIFYSDMS